MRKPRRGDTPVLSGIYGSERLPNRDERRLAKQALRRGEEPQPRHYTPKLWND